MLCYSTTQFTFNLGVRTLKGLFCVQEILLPPFTVLFLYKN